MAIVISVVLLIIISVYLLRTGQHVLLTFILAFAVFGFSSISYLIVSGWLFQGRLDKDIILRE